MNAINRIRFSGTTDPLVRWYGVSRRTTMGNVAVCVASSMEPFRAPPVTDAMNAAMNRICALPGVTEVLVRPYEIYVTLARVYDWANVHDDIVNILKEELFLRTEVHVQNLDDAEAPPVVSAAENSSRRNDGA